jgi:hypothetical protein
MAGGTGTQVGITTAPTYTAGRIIARVMRLIGVLATGEVPSSDEYNDALLAWQEMYDSWTIISSLPPVPSEVTHTLTVGTSDYTIGPTGDIVRVRPSDILNAILRWTDNQDYPVWPIGRDRYYDIGNKSLVERPWGFLYEQTEDDSKIRLSSKPDYAYTMVLYVLDPFTAPTAIDDDVGLQPGYLELIVYNLALKLMPEYGISIAAKPEIDRDASRTMRDVKNRYIKVPEMRPITGRGRYDVNSDRVR